MLTSAVFGIKAAGAALKFGFKHFWLICTFILVLVCGIQHKELNDSKKEAVQYVQTIASLESNLQVMQKAAKSQEEAVRRTQEAKGQIQEKISVIRTELLSKKVCASTSKTKGLKPNENPKNSQIVQGGEPDDKTSQAGDVLLLSLGDDVDRLLYDAETAAGASIAASSRVSE